MFFSRTFQLIVRGRPITCALHRPQTSKRSFFSAGTNRLSRCPTTSSPTLSSPSSILPPTLLQQSTVLTLPPQVSRQASTLTTIGRTNPGVTRPSSELLRSSTFGGLTSQHAFASKWARKIPLSISALFKRYASGSKSCPPQGQGKSTPAPACMMAFMNARPFDDIPGPTAIYQSTPYAGTFALYYPFSEYPKHNMGPMLSKLQAKYGPIMRVRIGPDWLVLIENLQDIEKVVRAAEQEDISRPTWAPDCTARGHTHERCPMPFNCEPRVCDSALYWLDGSARSKKLRQAVAHHLSSFMVVDRYLQNQDVIAQDLITNLDVLKDSPKEVQTLCYRYAIESVVQMCLNERVGLLNEGYYHDQEKQTLVSSFRMVVKCLGETQTGTRVLHHLFEDPFARRFKDAKHNLSLWERQLMREATTSAIRTKGIESLGPDERSLMISLLDDKTLTEQEIFDTMHGLMTTAADSVACSLQMLLFSLATNADKQETLYNEITKVCGGDGALTPRALDSLDYLKACVKESLRLNFPMSAGGRVILTNNIVLSDFLVPAGTQIVVNSRRTAKNPLWFEHPNFYLPERWLGDNAKDIPTLAFMPFGFGASLCPSRTFALQELHAACVRILQRFQVNLPGEYHGGKVETCYTPFRAPREPLPFHFVSKSGKSSKAALSGPAGCQQGGCGGLS